MSDYAELDWKDVSWPGIRLAFLESLTDGSARVLIEMAPHSSYPAHRHNGEEQVFVIRGSYRDAAAEYGAGSFRRFPSGSAHTPIAGPEGALLLACAEQGIEILEPPSAGR
ncbi:MAG TPA: cupin domain-containing protein [Planctomycetota bacterium]